MMAIDVRSVGDPDYPLRLIGTFKIAFTFRTSIACPAQWDGSLADGSYVYLRYRHGRGRIEWSQVRDVGPVYLAREWSDGTNNGMIDLDEFCRIADVIPPDKGCRFERIYDL